jgi:hypothetical protein
MSEDLERLLERNQVGQYDPNIAKISFTGHIGGYFLLDIVPYINQRSAERELFYVIL